MKWKLIFGILFIVFTMLSLWYANKSLVTYQRNTIETIYDTPTIFHNKEVTKTYEDNYAANGGAIAFGMLDAASLLAFASLLRKDKPE